MGNQASKYASLYEAACNGDARQLKKLLASGLKPDGIKDASSWTPLIAAADKGRTQCVHELLKAKADANFSTPFHNTALLQAAYCGHLDCVTELLKAKVDVKPKDTEGNDAIFYAKMKNRRDIVEEIVEARDRFTCFMMTRKAKADRLAREWAKADADALAKEQADADRLAGEKAETKRLAKEQAEAKRLAKQAEAKKLARKKAEAKKLAREKAEAKRLAREQDEVKRLARKKAEADRVAKEHAEAKRLAREKIVAKRLINEKAETELRKWFAANDIDLNIVPFAVHEGVTCVKDLTKLANKDLEGLVKKAGLNLVNRHRLINAVARDRFACFMMTRQAGATILVKQKAEADRLAREKTKDKRSFPSKSKYSC